MTFTKNTSRLFWLFTGLHFLIWALLPSLIQHNAPLDVVEGFAWGREWLIGTHKHPPLQAWLLEILGSVLGGSNLTHFGLAALCVSLTHLAVYRTGILLLNRDIALLAALATTGILYFNFLSTEFNPNSLCLALWAWAGYYFAKCCVKASAKSWLKFACIAALGLYAKLATVFLLLGFVLFFFAHKETRAQLTKPWPYLAALLCTLLFTPHLHWLYVHDFMPLAYVKTRVVAAASLLQSVSFQLKFLSAQIGCMALSLLLCLLLLFKNAKTLPQTLQQRVLLWLAFGPLVISITLALLDGQKMKDMWGMPFLSFIPLWLLAHLRAMPHEKILRRYVVGCMFLFALTPILFAGSYFYAPQLGYKPLRGHFPGHEVSAVLRDAWQKETGAPLIYVIGDVWLAGNVALYVPSYQTRPRVFIDGNPEINLTISTDDIKKKGALIIWRGESNIPPLPATLGTAVNHTSEIFPYAVANPKEPEGVTINWAYIKPSASDTATP